MTSKIHVALIGMGSQGKEHIEAAQKHHQINIVAGVESSAEARKALALSYPDILLFDNIAALKQASQDLGLQGLILALPHHVYEENWQDILAFNLPLLKEKPLGRNYQEAQDFVLQANNKGIVLQTAIQRRHHPSYQFLRSYIQQQQLTIEEIHAHLHLGKKLQPPQANNTEKWRDLRLWSGGGALLDTGYHLVDLLHYLIGPFELVSATIWGNDKLDDGRLIDDRAWLTARAEQCWISIDTWVHGSAKSEQVMLLTNKGILTANREGVALEGESLFSTQKEWHEAMLKQLSEFAHNIQQQKVQDETIWEQLPAMRLIEEAYRLASRY